MIDRKFLTANILLASMILIAPADSFSKTCKETATKVSIFRQVKNAIGKKLDTPAGQAFLSVALNLGTFTNMPPLPPLYLPKFYLKDPWPTDRVLLEKYHRFRKIYLKYAIIPVLIMNGFHYYDWMSKTQNEAYQKADEGIRQIEREVENVIPKEDSNISPAESLFNNWKAKFKRENGREPVPSDPEFNQMRRILGLSEINP